MNSSYQDVLFDVLDQVRAIAEIGLTQTSESQDRIRYERLKQISLTSMGRLFSTQEQELNERFLRDLGCPTPKVGVSAAVFDVRGRILVHRRKDDNTWCLPSGWGEVGRRLTGTLCSVVETLTGQEVKPTYIIGIYESKPSAPDNPHNCCRILFLCSRKGGVVRMTDESVDIGWYHLNAIDPWHPGHQRQAEDAQKFLRERSAYAAIRID